MLYFSAPMTLVSLTMSVMNYRRQIKNYRHMEQLRLQKYDEYLDEQEEKIRQLQQEQRRILVTTHPATADCLPIAAEACPPFVGGGAAEIRISWSFGSARVHWIPVWYFRFRAMGFPW